MKPKWHEGVPYYPFSVRYRTKGGKRKSLTIWSPGEPWVRDEIARYFEEHVGVENITPRSVSYRLKKPRARSSR